MIAWLPPAGALDLVSSTGRTALEHAFSRRPVITGKSVANDVDTPP
jgi:hypothetical protein